MYCSWSSLLLVCPHLKLHHMDDYISGSWCEGLNYPPQRCLQVCMPWGPDDSEEDGFPRPPLIASLRNHYQRPIHQSCIRCGFTWCCVRVWGEGGRFAFYAIHAESTLSLWHRIPGWMTSFLVYPYVWWRRLQQECASLLHRLCNACSLHTYRYTVLFAIVACHRLSSNSHVDCFCFDVVWCFLASDRYLVLKDIKRYLYLIFMHVIMSHRGWWIFRGA